MTITLPVFLFSLVALFLLISLVGLWISHANTQHLAARVDALAIKLGQLERDLRRDHAAILEKIPKP